MFTGKTLARASCDLQDFYETEDQVRGQTRIWFFQVLRSPKTMGGRCPDFHLSWSELWVPPWQGGRSHQVKGSSMTAEEVMERKVPVGGTLRP